MMTVMSFDIRDYRPVDEDAVIALSLRAWAPVFVSLQTALGREVFARLHPDWRQDQATAVREVLADPVMRIWVAVDGADLGGFAAARLHADRLLGEIYMLAVDPGHQHRGAGTALTETATAWLRESGMRVAMGGDRR
jgi:ribosomal protein S18 acetylase RimI-like enzyme